MLDGLPVISTPTRRKRNPCRVLTWLLPGQDGYRPRSLNPVDVEMNYRTILHLRRMSRHRRRLLRHRHNSFDGAVVDALLMTLAQTVMLVLPSIERECLEQLQKQSKPQNINSILEFVVVAQSMV